MMARAATWLLGQYAALTLIVALAMMDAAAARTFYAAGAGGVPLAVTDVGPTDGPEILFLHGIGQGARSFSPQFDSGLAEKFHMVGFDLRGHGSSGKPWAPEDYRHPDVWAEDVDSVLRATGLRRPVLVAWSYGTLVAADEIRVKGADHLSGLVLVGALGGFVPAVPPPASGGPAEQALARAHDLQQSLDPVDQQAASRLVSTLLSAKPVQGWTERAVLLGTLLPPYVQPLLRLPLRDDNGTLVSRLTLPVLVVHGAQDGSEPQAAVDAFLRVVPGAKESRYATAGHSPFAEDAARFNRELATFVKAHWHAGSR